MNQLVLFARRISPDLVAAAGDQTATASEPLFSAGMRQPVNCCDLAENKCAGVGNKT
jgi:hypothetical protein